MSTDSYFHVPAGMRNLPLGERRYCKHKTFVDFVAYHGDRFTHQVKWVAGGWIDEQYFFEDAMDARWFFAEGWRSLDFEDAPGVQVGYAPTALWIDGQEVKEDPDFFGEHRLEAL
jgi:hypothetical protein